MNSTVGACSSCGCMETSCAGCTKAACLTFDSCCCSPSHAAWRRKTILGGVKLESVSLGWMSVEVAGSIVAGLLAGSIALLAFCGDSVVEMISAGVVTMHIRREAVGLGGPGRRTSLLAAALLFSLIPVIGVGAVYSYMAGIRPEGSLLGIAIAAGAVVIMPVLWAGKKRIGDERRYLPMKIDAVESATCFFMSLALLGGLLAEYLLGGCCLVGRLSGG